MIMLDRGPTHSEPLASRPSLSGVAQAWFWLGSNRHLTNEVRRARSTQVNTPAQPEAGQRHE